MLEKKIASFFLKKKNTCINVLTKIKLLPRKPFLFFQIHRTLYSCTNSRNESFNIINRKQKTFNKDTINYSNNFNYLCI